MCVWVRWEMNKLVFYELKFGEAAGNNRATVCEVNVDENCWAIYAVLRVCWWELSFQCFRHFLFLHFALERHPFVQVCPLPLKNRLIPLWHAICGWVIDSKFFLVVVVLQKLFFPLPTFKQFLNKLFIPNFSNCFLSESSAKVLFANCFFPSFSPHCSRFSCFPSSNVTHFCTRKNFNYDNKKKHGREGEKTFNAIFPLLTPLSRLSESVLAKTASKHAIQRWAKTYKFSLHFVVVLAVIIWSLIPSLLIEWNLKRDPYFNQLTT